MLLGSISVVLLTAGFVPPPTTAGVARFSRPINLAQRSRGTTVRACDPPEQKNDEDAGYPGRETVRKVAWALFEVQEVFFQFLGAALALGLIVNLCGFGYEFNRQDGLVVKPLTEFRQENRDRQNSSAPLHGPLAASSESDR